MQTLELPLRRTQLMVGMLVLCAIGFTSCYFAYEYFGDWYRLTPLRTLIAILLGALGLVSVIGLLAFIYRLFNFPKYGLRLDSEGIHFLYADLKGRTVRWNEIRGFGKSNIGMAKIITVQLTDNNIILQHYSGLKLTLLNNLVNQRGTPVGITPLAYTGMTEDKLMALLEEYKRNSGV